MASPPIPRPKELVEAPIDWVEERSGLVSLNRYLLFRNVPSDISWLQTLGSALLTTFAIQAVTGVILAMYYHPDPNGAFASIRFITDDATLGLAGARHAQVGLEHLRDPALPPHGPRLPDGRRTSTRAR